MNKLIIALMATAFAGSVMAADAAKMPADMSTPAAATATEKPAAAPKKASHKRSKKVSKKSHAKAVEPATPAEPAKK